MNCYNGLGFIADFTFNNNIFESNYDAGNAEAILDLNDNLNIVEYFSSDSISCNLNGECKLKPVLNDALNSFKLKLREYTLADII